MYTDEHVHTETTMYAYIHTCTHTHVHKHMYILKQVHTAMLRRIICWETKELSEPLLMMHVRISQ